MNRRLASGALMIVGTSLSIQIAAAIAQGLFSGLGPVGVSGLRFALGTLVIVPLVRPRYRGHPRATWIAVTAYGVSLAALNLLFFEAIARLQLGIAVTFAFVAPLIMAIANSRRRRDVGFALLAGAGVLVLGGIDSPGSAVGVMLALSAGAAWVGVAYAARSVGRLTPRIDGLAMAVPIACLVTLPLASRHLRGLDTHDLLVGLVIAVGGLILPFGLELEGLRRLEPRVVAIIYSVDPAIAALVGLVVLSQHLTAPQVGGMAAVICASTGVTAGAALPEGGVETAAASRATNLED